MKCKCNTMRESLLGDGCEVCNPAKALEYAKENIAALTAHCADLEQANKDCNAWFDALKVRCEELKALLKEGAEGDPSWDQLGPDWHDKVAAALADSATQKTL